MTAAKTVALVLDPDFGEQLAELHPDMSVWVLASAQNSPVVDRLRQNRTTLTLLLTMPGETARDLFRRALANIEEHHGLVSGHRYNKVNLFGLEPHAISWRFSMSFHSTSTHTRPGSC